MRLNLALGNPREMTDDFTRTDTPPSIPTWLVVLRIVGIWVVLAGLIVVLVRQSGWTLGWIYVGMFGAGHGIFSVCLLLWNPAVLVRRMGFRSGTKTWDQVFIAVFLPTLFALFFVAVNEFDTPAGELGTPGMAWLIGLALYVSGWTLFIWASLANPFFEKTVRIQTDQGHHVIDRGPYACIRHPGYVGLITTFLATPLLLFSSWICVLSLITALLLVIRTALEDRTLQEELPGYAEYATKVRFRLIPGVW